MPVTRRAFLGLVAATPLLPYPLRLFAASRSGQAIDTLPAFLDTLMPADESPAASELGVDQRILQKADEDPQYRRLLLNGCLWLETVARTQYRHAFARLGETERGEIVDRMTRNEAPALAAGFFQRMQLDLFQYYYSHPASWRGLAVDRPPQPFGYTDYHEPPDASR